MPIAEAERASPRASRADAGGAERDHDDGRVPTKKYVLAALLLLAACNRSAPSDPPSPSSSPSASASAPSPLATEASPPGDLLPRPSIALELYRDAALSAAFTPDRRLIAVAEQAGSAVLILDRATFAERARAIVSPSIGPIAFSADGRRLAVSSGRDGGITLHDTATGARVGPSFPGRGVVESVALDRSGAQLAVGIGDGTVVLWDTGSGQMLAQSQYLGSLVNGVHFTPGDDTLLAQSGELTALTVPTLARRHRISSARVAPALLRGGTRLVVGCEDSKLCVHDAADGRFLRKLLGAHVFTAAADDRAVVYVKNGALVFQDVETGDVLRRAPLPSGIRRPLLLRTSADDRRVVAFTDDAFDSLVEWEVETQARTRSYAGLPERIGALAFADDTHLVVATAAGRTITLDLDGAPPSPITAHGEGTADATALLRRGAIVARAFERRVDIWDRGGADARASLDVPRSPRVILSPAADGAMLLAASSTRLSLWSPDGPAPVVRAPLPGYFSGVALGPGGALIAVTDQTRLALIDTAAGSARPMASTDNAFFDRVAISPDGARIAAATNDGTKIALYATATGQREQTLSNPQRLSALTFSPDGHFLAAATERGGISIWDAQTGSLHGTLDAHEDRIVALAVSPDGRFLAAGADHGAVALIRLAPLSIALRYTPLRAGGQTCAISREGQAACFGAGAEEGLVCRVAGRTQPIEACAGKRAARVGGQ